MLIHFPYRLRWGEFRVEGSHNQTPKWYCKVQHLVQQEKRTAFSPSFVKSNLLLVMGIRWYSRRDLNLRLLPSEGSTLSTELREHNKTALPRNDRDLFDPDRIDRAFGAFGLRSLGNGTNVVHSLDNFTINRIFVIKGCLTL